jgi:hypothetical protein
MAREELVLLMPDISAFQIYAVPRTVSICITGTHSVRRGLAFNIRLLIIAMIARDDTHE